MLPTAEETSKILPKKCGPKGPSRYTKKYLKTLALKLIEYAKATDLPLLKEFAYQNDIPSAAIASTCTREKSFAIALSKYKEIQETKWCRAIATNKANVCAGIFILKNISDMRDEQHIKSEHTERKVVLIRDDRASRETAPLLPR